MDNQDDLDKQAKQVAEMMWKHFEKRTFADLHKDLPPMPKQESALSISNMYFVITSTRRIDPFQESGIQKDWICVAHPAMHRILREMQFENPRTLGDNIAGRPVFYNPKAPNGEFTFYSPQKARELFADDNDIIAYLNREK